MGGLPARPLSRRVRSLPHAPCTTRPSPLCQIDPSEAYPLTNNGTEPTDATIKKVIADVRAAYKTEVANFVYGHLVPAPDQPGEGPGKYGVCCDRSKGCDCNGKPSL